MTAIAQAQDDDAELVEQIISAWAFAHNIDGAARNDLFARLRAAARLSVTTPDTTVLAFDLLEGLKRAYRDAGDEAKAMNLAAGFSRATGGIDVEFLIKQLGPPRYAQPCFNHEYITPGCSDCGWLA